MYGNSFTNKTNSYFFSASINPLNMQNIVQERHNRMLFSVKRSISSTGISLPIIVAPKKNKEMFIKAEANILSVFFFMQKSKY